MIKQEQILIVGSNGQLGRALANKYPKAILVDSNNLDITDKKAVDSFPWDKFSMVINAAAYTKVDEAETYDGRLASWKVNAIGVANLVESAIRNNLLMIHISTDYVFDGKISIHTENEDLSPLGVYGQSKAAGDLLMNLVPKHYLLRTSWVIGDGNNFVNTMLELGKINSSLSVVSDQIGRPTFTQEIVRVINHLIINNCPYGTYNISNDGKPVSWAELTREIFRIAGCKTSVKNIKTVDYYADKPNSARRPLNSVLDLTKIKKTGFMPTLWKEDLTNYIKEKI